LSNTFPIQSGLKQGDALLLLFFTSDSEYAFRKIQKSQEGLKYKKLGNGEMV